MLCPSKQPEMQGVTAFSPGFLPTNSAEEAKLFEV
jgi:hypothetical protein